MTEFSFWHDLSN